MNMNADAIVCYTGTGNSARRLSGIGPGCPILAITNNKRTFYQLGLVWNVYPVFIGDASSVDEVIDKGVQKLKDKGFLEEGDKVILSGGRNFFNGVKYSKIIGGYIEI